MVKFKYLVFFGWLLLSALVFAESGSESGGGAYLETLEKDVARLNKVCIQLEQDAVYKDEKVKVVYDRVKKLEKQLNQAREDLVKELEQVSEIHKAREERKLAYAKLLEARKAVSEGSGGK